MHICRNLPAQIGFGRRVITQLFALGCIDDEQMELLAAKIDFFPINNSSGSNKGCEAGLWQWSSPVFR